MTAMQPWLLADLVGGWRRHAVRDAAALTASPDDGLPPVTVVHVLANDPAAPLDLPAWCHLTGHDYLGLVAWHSRAGLCHTPSSSSPESSSRRPWHTGQGS